MLHKIALIGIALALVAPGSGAVPQETKETSEERVYKIQEQALRLFYEGNFEAAKLKFREAFLIAEKTPESIPERYHVGSLKMEGLCYQYLDELDQALALFHEALRLDEQLGSSGGVADALNIIGWALYLKGEYEQALEYLHEAEPLVKPGEGTSGLRGRILIDMGVVYSALGNHSLAFKHLQDGLEQINLIPQRDPHSQTMEITRALQHLGNLEREWGNLTKALEHYDEAVRVGREVSSKPYDPDSSEKYNRAYLVDALNDLGTLYGQQRMYNRAQAAFQEALAMSRQLNMRRLMARSLLNLGNLARDQKHLETAVRYHQQALATSEEIALRPLMGMALAELGWDSLQMGNSQQAIQLFQRAFDAGGNTLPPEVRTRIYSGFAEAYQTLGDWKRALEYYQLTIESIEKVHVGALTEDRKIGYWQSKQATFERAISLLSRLHQKDRSARYDARAFAYAEQARARAFLDLLAEAKVRVRRGLSPEVQREEQAIFQEITKIRKKLLREGLSKNETTRLERALMKAEEQRQEFEQRLRLTNPAYAALQYPEPFQLEKVQKEVLDDETLLIEFMLGEEKSFLWAVSKKECQMVELPGRGSIESQVRSFRRVITSPPIDTEAFDRFSRQAFRLHTLLLKPIEKMLREYKQLVIIPDGILHYLPFEALATGRPAATRNRPPLLLMSHRISYAPSASSLGMLAAVNHRTEEKRSQMELLAYGDPVFSGTQLVRSNNSKRTPAQVVRSLYRERGWKFGRLRYTREEVESIAALYPQPDRKVVLGKAAIESAVKRESLDRYRSLHFATHGLIDERVPARSGIALSFVGQQDEDGILEMGEIFNLTLDADLVVLSACRTGLGRLVRGEGIVGLTRAVMYAGSSSVVVSLWNVQDASTAEFMKTFYRHLKAGKRKAEALRQAKLEMIRADIPSHRFPYFWAAFVLVG
jgi:CHAT domain-containing protein/Tfp pilus assembly protein PilF